MSSLSQHQRDSISLAIGIVLPHPVVLGVTPDEGAGEAEGVRQELPAAVVVANV